MIKNDVIFFDGVCNLCSHSVQWVIEHDVKKHFRFASLQSDFARKTLGDKCPKGELKSIVVRTTNGKIYKESRAVLYIMRHCSGFYSVIGKLLLPISGNLIFDSVYRFISRNRYTWFGKQDACWIPTPELRSLFLD